MRVEGIVSGHYAAWRRGEDTPLRAALDGMYARWLAVGDGERLVLTWPVQPLPHASSTLALGAARGRRASNARGDMERTER